MSISTVEPQNRPPDFQDCLSPDDVKFFHEQGYVIVRGLADPAVLQTMLQVTKDGLANEIAPVEYEADVHYPGAPQSRGSVGGRTIRRLQQAHSRHPIFTEWLAQAALTNRLRQLMGPDLVMPLVHHNCIMTKQPEFSSDTGWHQDIRYWSFEQPELVSVWLALGEENPQNGCLRLLPGTHRQPISRDRLDDALFLRDDLEQNQEMLATQVHAKLNPSDVLLFHCRTFHAASRNHTAQPKYSAVFTFRPADNRPLAGTRSASLPELLLPPS